MPQDAGSTPNVAIACQGGGSHAAFVAGVLMELLSERYRDRFDPVALSGTSGGAMCAALAWAGLLGGGPEDAIRRLDGFWRDLEVHDFYDVLMNFWAVTLARLPVTEEISPYAYEPVAKPALETLLAKHLRLGEVTPLSRAAWPRLCVGATDILSGDRTVFRGDALTEDKLIASAAIPPIFRAVEIDRKLYWDGLFATNPPIRDLIDEFPRPPRGEPIPPKEIWVVQVNPQHRTEEPRSMRDISDRRNELAGNLSLAQELYVIQKINELLHDFDSLASRYDHITLRVVEMDLPDLDYPSKLNRSSAHIERLLRHGADRAGLFFERESLWPRDDAVTSRTVKA